MNMNKKAVEMNINTIIIVILAILVLVILALYFTGGMKALWGRITGVGGAYNEADVASARQLCRTFCTVNDEQSFCTTQFNLKKGDTTEVKYCDQSPIEAQKSSDCSNFIELDCSKYRTTE